MSDARLSDMTFPFLRVAPRPVKPRKYGLTIVADRGMGSRKLADLIETAGEFIDYAKVGIGAYRLQTEAFVRQKVKTYHDADIKVFFAGDVTEVAFMSGQSAKFYEAVSAMGGDAVEVSSAQVAMSLHDKCRLIRMATGLGLQVVAEAGQKGHDDWTRSQSYIAKQIEAYFQAGAWKVLIQGEGISEGTDEMKSDLMLNIVSRFDPEQLIFQAKDTSSQVWYLNAIGNGANLDVDDGQVIDVELMRRGIRKRGLFGLIGSLEEDI